MALSLEEFVTEVKAEIEAFAAEYRAQHAENPEHYPLALGDDNEGLWAEFFMDFMTRSVATTTQKESWDRS